MERGRHRRYALTRWCPRGGGHGPDAFGTKEGTVDIEGRVQSVAVDDTAMKEIADLSGGDFYRAATAEQLRKVYDTLGEQIGNEIKEADASKPWLMLGTLAALIAAGSALLIGQRGP